MRWITLLVITIVSLLNGCTSFYTSTYNSSADNVLAMRAMDAKHGHIGVGPIRDQVHYENGDSNTGIVCRNLGFIAAGPVSPSPTGITYSGYIRNALIMEMELAGIYSKTSQITITLTLTQLEYSTSLSQGYWKINTYVSIGTKQPFPVNEYYKFDASFSGGEACPQAANAFEPAVQELIHKIITNEVFQQTIQSLPP